MVFQLQYYFRFYMYDLDQKRSMFHWQEKSKFLSTSLKKRVVEKCDKSDFGKIVDLIILSKTFSTVS